MADRISRFMDGELDDVEVQSVCAQLKDREAMSAWTCYHVIGDSLRRTDWVAAGFGDRFAARLAGEPTVLAPVLKRNRPVPLAWAVAATVAAVALTGWVALSTLDTSSTALAKASEAAVVRAAQVRPSLPSEYLVAHQEYSPTTQIVGIGPNFRAASVAAAEAPK